MSKTIMHKTYSDESMIDLAEDIDWAVEQSGIEQDEHGFRPGTYTVTVTWEDDE